MEPWSILKIKPPFESLNHTESHQKDHTHYISQSYYPIIKSNLYSFCLVVSGCTQIRDKITKAKKNTTKQNKKHQFKWLTRSILKMTMSDSFKYRVDLKPSDGINEISE